MSDHLDSFTRIQEESIESIIEEVIDRSNLGCLVTQLKSHTDPCIVYHADSYTVGDILKMIANLELAKDWFKKLLQGIDDAEK